MSTGDPGTGEGQHNELGLAEAIADVRRELETAINQGKNSTIGFETESVELQLELAFAKAGTVKSGLRVWVVSVEAQGQMSQTSTHRLTLSLRPFDRTARKNLEISDTDSDEDTEEEEEVGGQERTG